MLKKAFTNALYVHYPGMQKAFTDITGKTLLAFITKFPTPHDLLNASSDEVLNFLITSSRRGLKWANAKLEKLLSIASDASVLGITPLTFASKVNRFVSTYHFYEKQCIDILDEIKAFINSAPFADEFNHNISLLRSFKGAGFVSAVTLLVEMNDIKKFYQS